jgi:capsular polysaccharide biosynthesis protein
VTEFSDYRKFFTANLYWIAASTALGVVFAMAAALWTPPRFVATSELFLATPGYSAAGAYSTNDTSPYQADGFSQQRARTYVKLANRTDLARRVIDQLGVDMRPEDLADSISASVHPDTVLIDVAVKSQSPTDAKVLADAVIAELASDIRKLETPAGMRISSVDPVITQPADVPQRPVEPMIWLLLVMGLSVGFLLGITTAAFRARRRLVAGAGDVIDGTGRPLLGIVSIDESDSLEWQMITRNVDSELEAKTSPVIAVATLDAGSNSAAELAQSFAHEGRRVVLVSLVVDGAAGQSHNDRPPVLSAAVAGDLASALQLVDGNSFYRLSPGLAAMRPLLESERFRAVIEQLRTSFDLVILEESGLTKNLSSVVVVAPVDGVVLIVTEQKTAHEDLAAFVQELRHSRIPLLGTVLKSRRPYDRLPNVGKRMVHQGGLPDENV